MRTEQQLATIEFPPVSRSRRSTDRVVPAVSRPDGSWPTPLEQCMTMMLPITSDPYGNQVSIEAGDQVPFDIARVYYLYDIPGGASLGGQAHRTQHQLIIAMSGSFDIRLGDGENSQVYHLNRSHVGLYVAPMVWQEFDNFATNSVCMVLASDHYDEAEYYRSYEGFISDVAKAARDS